MPIDRALDCALPSRQAERVLIGLISDVHGNGIALDAVIADGMAEGVEAWWVLGDLVAIGPDPVSTLERLSQLPSVRFVSGNTDRYVVTGERPPPHADDVDRAPSLRPLFDAVESSFAWTREAVETQGWLAWLADLPSAQRARSQRRHASCGRSRIAAGRRRCGNNAQYFRDRPSHDVGGHRGGRALCWAYTPGDRPVDRR